VTLQLLPDVVFDQAAAARAADECRAAAERLRTVRDRRAQGADHAGAGWEGAARTDFDTVAGAIDRDADDLHRRLLSTASQIERAMADAAAEQARRDAENDRRREEHRREQERRAAEATERSRIGGPR
jgi:hypothetical protein